jgi:hypothetical protein
MWTNYGLQPLNLTDHVLGLNPATSDVTLQPVPATDDGIAPEQDLVFRQGQFWDRFYKTPFLLKNIYLFNFISIQNNKDISRQMD